MKVNVSVSGIFCTDIERAFKTPFLCDISKIHTGYFLIPKAIKTKSSSNWGEVGSIKKVYFVCKISRKISFFLNDRIVKRCENKIWVIQIDNFPPLMLSFTKFVGKWKTTRLVDDKILIAYSYELHFSNPLLYPICWLFGNLLWKNYMKEVLNNVKKLAYDKEPYKFE